MKSSKNTILFRTSWISTLGNGLLSIGKLIVGFITGSLAVISDGIDSASDVVVSIVMIYTSRIVSRPPDKAHVYGYEKAEGIATKILSMIIFYAGMQMLVSSLKSIFSGVERELPGMLAIYITIFSIIGKLCLSYYQFKQGKKIESQMLIANAKNMRNDVLISAGVLVGLFFTTILKLPILDTITGLIISLFILRTAIGIFMDSNTELMDGVKDTSVYDKIFEAVEETSNASNPHRVRSRSVGGMYMISLDIEVDGKISITEAHKIANEVEDRIRGKIPNVYDIRIHVEPEGISRDGEKFGLEKK